jgi:hypothetical protein
VVWGKESKFYGRKMLEEKQTKISIETLARMDKNTG